MSKLLSSGRARGVQRTGGRKADFIRDQWARRTVV